MGMLTLYLGNDWRIKRDRIRDGEVIVAGPVAARGFLSAEEFGEAIHADLEEAGTIAAGAFAVVVQGTAITEHLEALLDSADLEGRELVVYDRVVVDDQDYSDFVPVRVKRARPAGAF